jgi:Asp/Glu/hydantoin racemase
MFREGIQVKFQFIPPFKTEYAPGQERRAVRCLSELEDEGFLEGIQWDLAQGIPGPSPDTREDMAAAIPGVLKHVREACESRKYDALILLGGLEPGLYAAKEIATPYGIPVIGGTSSEVAFASILGNRYSIIEALDWMAIAIRQNIVSYGMNEKCASVRSIEWLPGSLKGDPPEAADAFVGECIEAIEKDGADVIVVGCNALLWIQPLAQKRLKELGYEVPVLHPYKCAIEMAKALVNMKVSQSKFAFPSGTPKKKAIPR